MKNKYEKLFDEFLDLTEFTLVKYNNGWGLKDNQNGNLGNIEQDRFKNAAEIFDRMDIYIEDYIAEPLKEVLRELDVTRDLNFIYNFNELIDICYIYYPPLNKWDIEVLDMICNHPMDIDLNNCYYEKAKNKTLMQMLLEGGVKREDMDTHESDLYVYVEPLTTEIINKWCKENNFNRQHHCPQFIDQITKRKMYDCAFCNDEYWKEKFKN